VGGDSVRTACLCDESHVCVTTARRVATEISSAGFSSPRYGFEGRRERVAISKDSDSRDGLF
jgi:hypothetical protein